jgi:molybdate-binding protein/DNA-binding XRE family transcriptional regulator
MREQRGLSQVTLAEFAQLSRQSVGAIEAGRATPAVDVALRLARALRCSVEALFDFGGAELLEAEPSGPHRPGRVAVAHIAGRWVSYALGPLATSTAAGGIAGATAGTRVTVAPLGAPGEASCDVVAMGCAAGLGVLADRMNGGASGGRALWLSRSSTAALQALGSAQAHVAGTHLVDAVSGEVNTADVRRLLGNTEVVLLTLAHWEMGLVTAPGNPLRLCGGGDLWRPGLRVVAREQGSGARRLLERLRGECGGECAAWQPALEVGGHLEVAHAVAVGAADTGVASRDAAMAFGLSFLPLERERYDLAVSATAMWLPQLQRFFNTMVSGAYRRELESLGYETSCCGNAVDLPLEWAS